MRIAIIHNAYHYRGGEDSVVSFQAELLAAAGHEVHGFTVSNDDVFGCGRPVKALAAAMRSPWNRESYRRVKAFLDRCRPDVCHVHNWFPLLSPSVYGACRDLALPVVQTLHNYRLMCANATLFRDGRICELCLGGEHRHAVRYGCYRDSRLQSRVWMRVIDRNRRREVFKRMVDRYIAPSQVVAAKHCQAGLPESKIVVLPHGCHDPLAGQGMDHDTDYSRDDAPAVYVGRLSPEKSLMTLIESWRGMTRPLKLIGDGPDQAKLRSASSDNPNIEFAGRLSRDKVIESIRRSSFLVFCTGCYDTFGLGVVEAMACGRPVLATRLGGPAEIVVHEQTGLLVEPRSADAMRNAAMRLFSDRDFRDRCARTARLRYLERYTPEVHRRGLEAIYHDLTGRDQP